MSNQINWIVVLGGWLKKDGGRWRSIGFDEGDKFLGFGDRLRAVAAWYLYDEANKDCSFDVLIEVSGGKGKLRNIKDAPAMAEILKKELIELGVPEGKISEDKRSKNTFEQLRWLAKFIQKSRPRNVSVVSNKYHLPRIRTMIECFPELGALRRLMRSGKFRLISAETICLRRDPKKWRNVIRCGYALPHIKKIIRLEKQGVKDIKEGRYKL